MEAVIAKSSSQDILLGDVYWTPHWAYLIESQVWIIDWKSCWGKEIVCFVLTCLGELSLMLGIKRNTIGLAMLHTKRMSWFPSKPASPYDPACLLMLPTWKHSIIMESFHFPFAHIQTFNFNLAIHFIEKVFPNPIMGWGAHFCGFYLQEFCEYWRKIWKEKLPFLFIYFSPFAILLFIF